MGFDPAADRERFHISPSGIVVIPKAPEIPETRDRDLNV